MIRVPFSDNRSRERAASLEWLETNGIGGFAMGTVSGISTRRYHGTLTGAARPPLGRLTLVSKIEETIIIAGERYELGANRFPGKIHPRGFEFLEEFRLDPFPVWHYRVGGRRLTKRLFMPHGKNSTVCVWELDGPDGDAGLELRPLISFADYHHLRREDPPIDGSYREKPGMVTIRPYAELPELHWAHNCDAVEPTGHWYRNFQYAIEAERGFDASEDLYQPFVLRYRLDDPAVVIAGLEGSEAGDAEELEIKEITRRRELISMAGISADESPAVRQLVMAADQFIVKRGKGRTIIAGYPWFSDWGRDTMIALRGLTLATGRPDAARAILLEYSRHISEGMIPNRFPDEGETPDYNTVDATLWYFEAIRAYAEETGDYDLIAEELYDKLADIAAWHLRGTRYGIHVDTDGLLYAGEVGHQLTWMDAKIGDLVITPRIGKPVEIQALWYNSLRIMSDLADRFGHDKDRERFEAMADLAKLSFNSLFWNEETGCLYDVVKNGHRDGSVRPNQVFAISLAHPVLDRARWQAVMEVIRRDLLTTVGLRSLAPRAPAYVGTYIGSPLERDSAYHQGTVWGWLMGPYITAYRKTFSGKDREIAQLIAGMEEHLTEAGLGQISEIFDGDSPHTPRGCPAQAWSVGELLRVMREAN
jgi:predicted glycogen debranching enzyme